jgi:hypothetical protein
MNHGVFLDLSNFIQRLEKVEKQEEEHKQLKVDHEKLKEDYINLENAVGELTAKILLLEQYCQLQW